MGCDIHMVLEQKFEGTWVGLHGYPYELGNTRRAGQDMIELETWAIVTDRNYSLFGAIAGVRGESDRGNEPKGMPDDASPLARMMSGHWGEDGHSHSYLGLNEFVDCYASTTEEIRRSAASRLAGEAGKRTQSELTAICCGGFDNGDTPRHEVRIVFWFDN